MSKNKQQECAYCGVVSKTTRDHVVPRSLFPTPPPTNLVTVSACEKCNGGKSPDDDFLRDLLTTDVYGQQNPIAKGIFDTKVLRSAKRNSSLVARTFLHDSSPTPFYSHGGIYLSHLFSAPIDTSQLDRTLFTICRGLYFHVKNSRIPENYKITIRRYQPREFLEIYKRFSDTLHLNGPIEMGDVFLGSFVSVEEDPHSTIWLLLFYGIIAFSVSIMRPDLDLLMKSKTVHLPQKSWGRC